MKLRLCVILTFIVSSCGTFANVNSPNFLGLGKTYPYGGVAIDTVGIFSPFIAFCLIDLPFTVVGDTITLPYILYNKPYCEPDRESTTLNINFPLK